MIAQSGDYSIGTNVGPCLPGVDGIDIVASNVTLHLNGHTISGTATSGTCNSSNGIYVEGTSLLPLTMVHVLGSGTISNFFKLSPKGNPGLEQPGAGVCRPAST